MILLFEIGLESDLKELIRVGPQAAVVAIIGGSLAVCPPAPAGLIGLFGHRPHSRVFAGAALNR